MRVLYLKIIVTIVICVLNSSLRAGIEIPAWDSAQTNSVGSYRDVKGNSWTCYQIGGVGNLGRIDMWRFMNWNESVARWEGDILSDSSPSFTGGSLRTRRSSYSLGTLVFEPKSTGKYKLSGQMMVDTWGPDGTVKVYVIHIDANNVTRQLYMYAHTEEELIDWEKIEAVQDIRLDEGERLAFSVAASKSGTSILYFHPRGGVPTEIQCVSDYTLLVFR